MTQIVTHDSRSAIERAKLFLSKAKACSTKERVDFEAYLEASIIFGRAALHRFQSKYEKEAGFEQWWNSLLNDPSIKFFREERNFILKEGPPQIGQIIRMPKIPSLLNVGGHQFQDNEPDLIKDETTAPAETLSATDSYYYDDPSTPATKTVEDHLNTLESHINSFLNTINKP